MDMLQDLVKRFEKSIGTIEAQAAETDALKSEIARLTGQVDTLTTLTATKGGFVQRAMGKDIRWESKESAKTFLRFIQALVAKDFATVRAMNENNAGTGSEADGGQLVPVEFKPTLIQVMEQYGMARAEATVIPMVRDEIQWPVYDHSWKDANGAVTTPAYWVDENTPGTQTWPQFTNVSLVAKKLMAIVPASNELIQDSSIPIAGLIAQLVGEYLAKEEDRVAFVGSISGGDKFDGVLTAAGKTVTTATTDINAVTARDFLDMTAQLTRGALEGAKYYMHRSVFNIVRSLKDDQNRPIYNEIAEGAPGTIYGYPVRLVESMPVYAGASAATRYVAFGNMKNYFMGDKMQLSVAASDIAGYLAFQTIFRFVERIGFKLPVANNFCALKTHA